MANNAQPGIILRVPTLDLLRGIAILGVISIHSSQVFSSGSKWLDFVAGNGWVGVQLFFFVSAFTMCHMWRSRQDEGHRVLKFYARRFLRIAPLFWIAIPLYLFINGSGANAWAPDGVTGRDIALTALFLHGFTPTSLNSVVPGGWSIAVEMTFYACFPLLATLFGKRAYLYLIAAVAVQLGYAAWVKPWAAAICSQACGTTDAFVIKHFLHDNFLVQLPIFLLGCFAYYSLQSGLKWSTAVLVVLWIFAAYAVQAAFQTGEFHYLLIYLAIGALFYFGMSRGLRSSILEALGKQSYAMYLSHFVVVAALRAEWIWTAGPISFAAAFVLAVALTYGAARVIHRCVEKPVQAFADWLTDARRAGGGRASDRPRPFEAAQPAASEAAAAPPLIGAPAERRLAERA